VPPTSSKANLYRYQLTVVEPLSLRFTSLSSTMNVAFSLINIVFVKCSDLVSIWRVSLENCRRIRLALQWKV